LTQADYARRRGISRQRVNMLVKDGRIPLDDVGLVIVAAADATLETTLDRSRAHRARQIGAAVEAVGPPPETAAAPSAVRPDSGYGGVPRPLAASPIQADMDHVPVPELAEGGGSPGKGDADGYWKHKARRELAEAEFAELRVAERRGALIDAQAVRMSRLTTARRMATALRQLPAQLAPVAAPQDPQRVAQLWTEAIDKLLLDLAEDLSASDSVNESC